MPAIRRYQFSDLPRYTTEQAGLRAGLADYFTMRPFRAEFLSEIEAVLDKYLKVSAHLSEVSLEPVTRSDLFDLLPSNACVAVLGAAPTEHKILVEIDLALVGFAIDRVLGGTGETRPILRPLTDIEQGVLSFLLLELIAKVHEGWVTGRELSISLDRFIGNGESLRAITLSEGQYFNAGLSVGIGPRVGHVRVLLPHALLKIGFRTPAPQSDPTRDELEYMRTQLASLPETSVIGFVEAARLELELTDITELEPGDIIVLENHEIALDSGYATGTAFVRVGTGRNGGLRVRVGHEGDKVQLEILRIVVQEEPPEEPVEENNEWSARQEDMPEDNLAGTQSLLRDVPATVAVELGRLKFNTAQLVRLREGQILRLPRGANDPVDLTVDGKVFARGELIEIDGELGVRLQKVVGAVKPK